MAARSTAGNSLARMAVVGEGAVSAAAVIGRARSSQSEWMATGWREPVVSQERDSPGRQALAQVPELAASPGLLREQERAWAEWLELG